MLQRGLMRSLFHRAANRFALTGTRYWFKLRHALSNRTVWIRCGPILLPVTGDGDNQVPHYYVYGKKWWHYEENLLTPYIKPGSVAVDVGANHGFLTALFSKLAGPAGKIFSFEPSPVVFTKLSAMVAKNQLANVTLIHAGCGSQSGQMTLYTPQSSGNASLRPENLQVKDGQRGSLSESIVRVVKLDDQLPSLTRLDFVKIDTEGFEDEVLAGMRDLIARFRPVFYIELCNEFRSSSERAAAILRELNYRFVPELDLEHSGNGESYLAIPEKLS